MPERSYCALSQVRSLAARYFTVKHCMNDCPQGKLRSLVRIIVQHRVAAQQRDRVHVCSRVVCKTVLGHDVRRFCGLARRTDLSCCFFSAYFMRKPNQHADKKSYPEPETLSVADRNNSSVPQRLNRIANSAKTRKIDTALRAHTTSQQDHHRTRYSAWHRQGYATGADG